MLVVECQGQIDKWGASARIGKINIKNGLGKNHQWKLNLGDILMNSRLFADS